MWYLSLAQSAGELLDCPTGLMPADNDTCAVDTTVFQGFVQNFLEAYSVADNPVMRGIMRGVLLSSLVMLERAGVSISSQNEGQEILLREREEFASYMAV